MKIRTLSHCYFTCRECIEINRATMCMRLALYLNLHRIKSLYGKYGCYIGKTVVTVGNRTNPCSKMRVKENEHFYHAYFREKQFCWGGNKAQHTTSLIFYCFSLFRQYQQIKLRLCPHGGYLHTSDDEIGICACICILYAILLLSVTSVIMHFVTLGNILCFKLQCCKTRLFKTLLKSSS